MTCNPVLYLVLGGIFFISCNEQVHTASPNDDGNEPAIIIDGPPRMSRGLLQDRNGHFWLCSGRNEGVTLYDGKTFTRFTEKDGLSSNFVHAVLEDNSGKLWFGTADGITCFDGVKFTAIPITVITGNTSYRKTTADSLYGFPQPAENWIHCIMQDREGIFWFGTMTGVYRYDGKTYSHFASNDNAVNHTGVAISGIESIFQDNSGTVWFGGRGTAGVFRYDGKALTNFKPDGENWLAPVIQDKSGNIWFSTRTSRNRGILYYDGRTFNRFGQGHFSEFFFSIEEDNNGNLWFGNGRNSGVTFYDGKDLINYTEKDGLCNVFLRKIVRDKDGNIWFNCDGNGLCRFDGKSFSLIHS